MPATRSRTENWRQTLQAVYEKGGALEITLPRHADAAMGRDHYPAADSHLIWRVRILHLAPEEIVIEQPSALGHPVRLQPGVELVGLIVVGQNRWMFRTTNLGATAAALAGGRAARGYRLRMPDHVERCQRRNFYRISTIGLSLPRVEVYTVSELRSAALADLDNRCRILELLEHPAGDDDEESRPLLPDFTDMSQGTLVNIGGGGVGLIFDEGERPRLDTALPYWLRIALPPHVPAPLAAGARLRHTHIDSAQRVYAGMSFEFGHSPGHEKFVVDQLLRYVALVQREQLRRGAEAA